MVRYEQETVDAEKYARCYARSTICRGLSTFPFSFTITMKGTIKKGVRRIKSKGTSTSVVGLQERKAPNEVLCRLARYIALKDTLPSLATKFSEQERKHLTKFSVDLRSQVFIDDTTNLDLRT